MYGLARCVSLMFVVIIAFLSFCSGYRIDNVLAMTDLRRHRLQTITTQPDPPPLLLDPSHTDHKIRHSRHRHLHLQPTTEEHLAQIPLSLTSPPPTTSLSTAPVQVISRSQRSSSKRAKQRKGKERKRQCQKQDTFRKAAAANTVMRAKVQTQSASRKANSTYNVTFNILKVFKSREPSNHDTIRLAFAYSSDPSNCESDLGRGGLVRAKLNQSQEYYLFLNSHGSYNYTVYGLPVPVRKRRGGIETKIKRVCKEGFAQLLREPLLNRTTTVDKKDPKKRIHKLLCTAKGFPTPVIHWYKNGERLLMSRRGHKITYSRRKSTLVIHEKDKNDHGKYWCAAVGLNNTIKNSTEAQLNEGNRRFKGIPCNETLSEMCINGDCYMSEIGSGVVESFCVCKNNFQGLRCDEKTSTYQQNITSCNLPQYNISHFCKN